MSLRLYFDGNDWVVAEGVRDAIEVWQAYTGREWVQEHCILARWLVIPDERPLSICFKQAPQPEDYPPGAKVCLDNGSGPVVKAPAVVWARWKGRGVLCGMDWGSGRGVRKGEQDTTG